MAVYSQQSPPRALLGPSCNWCLPARPTRQDCERRTSGVAQQSLRPSPDLASGMADAGWTPPTDGRVSPVPHTPVRCRGCGAHAAPLLVDEAGTRQRRSPLG
ncbi:hypothetical protein NDU88_004580 [Pleurodeles waltl]|uniref:Uncharacterized protein n=1 Tax=Pleurodeles waltl TaxID=8319 RepID=A0AAV7QEZ9_PLEWA|nr:hypothetical protein NDU88_004580 [Pleurodeles waltl]